MFVSMLSDMDTGEAPLRAPPSRLPLIRWPSRPLSRYLASTRVTPNQVTLLGTATGLAAAACYLREGMAWALAGAALFALSYLLDNCDGELARLKGLQSRLGARLDELGDWAVHTALFLALGLRTAQEQGETYWLWLAGAAALGASMNTALALARRPSREAKLSQLSALPRSASWLDKLGFVLRGLIKADFWLLLLILTLGDLLWLLLLTAALGSHAFWLLSLRTLAKRFHT